MADQSSVTFGQQPINPRPHPSSVDVPRPPAMPPKRNPKLSRQDMVKTIQEGGSVIHKGMVIAHEDLLPTDDEMAEGDAAAQADLAKTIDSQIAYLQARQARLMEDATRPKPEVKTEPPKSEGKPGEPTQPNQPEKK